MKKQLYVLNGSAGVGKDLFVDIVRMWNVTNSNPYSNLPIYNISSVDMVKEAAILLGWNKTKDEKGRKFLSDLKILSTENYNGPFEYMQSKIKRLKKGILFFHIREPKEINVIVKAYPEIKTILIERPSVVIPDNIADKNVTKYDYDFYIKNDGTKEEYVKTICSWCKENLI